MLGTLYLMAHQTWGANNIFPLFLDTFKNIEALFNFFSTDK